MRIFSLQKTILFDTKSLYPELTYIISMCICYNVSQTTVLKQNKLIFIEAFIKNILTIMIYFDKKNIEMYNILYM